MWFLPRGFFNHPKPFEQNLSAAVAVPPSYYGVTAVSGSDDIANPGLQGHLVLGVFVSNDPVTAPVGWNELFNGVIGSNNEVTMQAYWKIVGASESTYTFTDANTETAGGILAFQNATTINKTYTTTTIPKSPGGTDYTATVLPVRVALSKVAASLTWTSVDKGTIRLNNLNDDADAIIAGVSTEALTKSPPTDLGEATWVYGDSFDDYLGVTFGVA